MKICVYGAASDKILPAHIAAGEQLGELMALRHHGLVFGGGAHGMMGAVARGAHKYGGEITGIAPRFFDVGDILFPDCTRFIFTEEMRERKALMEQQADAFITTAGGIGTYEEFFEILTLRQLSRHAKPIVLLNTCGCFDPLLALLEATIAQGFAKPICRELYCVCQTPQQALDYLEQAILQPASDKHYKNI